MLLVHIPQHIHAHIKAHVLKLLLLIAVENTVNSSMVCVHLLYMG